MEKQDSSVLFQSEEEMMEVLRSDGDERPTPNESIGDSIKLHDPLVVVWEKKNGRQLVYRVLLG